MALETNLARNTKFFYKNIFSPITTAENFLTTFSCIETCNELYISVKNQMHCQIPTMHKGPPPPQKKKKKKAGLAPPPPQKKCWSFNPLPPPSQKKKVLHSVKPSSPNVLPIALSCLPRAGDSKPTTHSIRAPITRWTNTNTPCLTP